MSGKFHRLLITAEKASLVVLFLVNLETTVLEARDWNRAIGANDSIDDLRFLELGGETVFLYSETWWTVECVEKHYFSWRGEDILVSCLVALRFEVKLTA